VSFAELCRRLEHEPFLAHYGKVKLVRRDSVRVFIPDVGVGTLCAIETRTGRVGVEIVALDPSGHVAMPLDDLSGVQLGDRVFVVESLPKIPVGEALLGRVVDSLGRPYEGAPLRLAERASLVGENLNPLERSVIREPMDLGVRALNACLTCGRGQRQGIFAGSGIGKSVLLGMIARHTAADVVVIGLLGERGREVGEFLEQELGPEGRKKAVVVVETADKSPVRRVRGAFAATAIAEYFRKRGAHVILLVDSLTRFAMAAREIGMATGESPTSKGYTPSVFGQLARVLERAGNWNERGSITGLYTVLVEGDDHEDPIADAARSMLDGHVVLSRKLANAGCFPAIDLLASVSRVMPQVVTSGHARRARRAREVMARFRDNEDAIHYGLYSRGTDPGIDEAIDLEPRIMGLLRQERGVKSALSEAVARLKEIFPEGDD